MRNFRALSIGLLQKLSLAILAELLLITTASCAGMSVRDSIAMVRFSDPFTRLADARCKFSPDRKSFFVITTQGDLRSNTMQSVLWVYSSDQVLLYLKEKGERPSPRKLFQVSGVIQSQQENSYGSLIKDALWSTDSRAVLGLVEQSSGYHHVFRMDLNGTVVDLTPGMDVRDFDEGGGTIAYLVARHMKPQDVYGPPRSAASSDLTGLSLFHIIDAKEFPDPSIFWPAVDVWVRFKGENRQVNTNSTWFFPTSAGGLRPAVSPDGRTLIIARPVTRIEPSWSQYKLNGDLSGFGSSHVGSDRSGRNFDWPWQYNVVDLTSMTTRPAVDAPFGLAGGFGGIAEAVWSSDGAAALFTNTYLPLRTQGGTKTAESLTPCAVAIYDVKTHATSCVVHSRPGHSRLQNLSFGAISSEAVLSWEDNGENTTTRYRRSETGWSLYARGADKVPEGLEVAIRQDLNSSPTLWASDMDNGNARLLWDPNPQLHTVELGTASTYHWKDNTGYVWSGALLLPPGFVAGHRYPLIIQTHGFANAHEFITEGSYTTGFAARPLAAAGFVVLQMGGRSDATSWPPDQEAMLALKGFESAIDHLNKDGLIDPLRVGLIGFSRTAWYVENALIKAPDRFRAASITDGVDESYMQYMLFAPEWPSGAREPETKNGGKPFGMGLRAWLKTAAGFNLNKVQTPLRVTAIGLVSLLNEWETYASLRMQIKPVDFTYIKNDQHILQSPQARYDSEQGSVDWFRFWLLGLEDPDSAKSVQYRHWEALCDLVIANKSAPLPACVPSQH